MANLPQIAQENKPGEEKLPDNVQPPPALPGEDPDSAAALAAAARLKAASKPPEGTTTPPPAEKPPVIESGAKEDGTGTPAKPDAQKVPEPVKPGEKVEDKWPRTAQDWKKFVAARDEGFKTRDDQIKSLTASKAELENRIAQTSAAPPDLEALTKERDQLSETLKRISVENHPKFKEYYGTQLSNQLTLAKKIVGAEKAPQLETIMNMAEGEYKDAQLSEFLMELNALQQTRLGGVMNKITELNLEREAEIAKSKENFTRLQADQEANSRKLRADLEKKFDTIIQQYQKDDENGNPAFIVKEGQDEWNSQVSERVKTARELLFGNKQTPERVIKAAIDAVAYPAVLQQALALMEKVKSLEAQISTLSAAAPKTTGTAPSTESPGEQMPTNANRAPVSGSRPMDVTAHWMKGLPPLK